MPRPLLFIDGAAGISGDMTLGALVDLGVPVQALREGLLTLRLPGWELSASPVVKKGIRATKVHVDVDGDDHHHAHPHGDHDHHHDDHHHGRSWPELRDVITASGLPPRAKNAALSVFRRLCEVEAEIHGVPLDEVHLHEAGAVDALIDICGACLGFELLGWPEIVAAPPDLGSGTVRCEHGLLPVPSPATLRLLEGLPAKSSGLPVELTTPTGAALLATLAARWGAMPAMTVRRSGFGAGTKDLPDRANVVRFTLGDSAEPEPAATDASHLLIEADLDDADPQLLAAFCDAAREAGALDATLSPLTMKKGRAGTRLCIVATEGTRERLLELLFRETTTIGCRIARVERAECERAVRDVTTPFGPVRVKVASWRGRIVNVKPEHDDCLAAARRLGVPLKDVVASASEAARHLLEPQS